MGRNWRWGWTEASNDEIIGGINCLDCSGECSDESPCADGAHCLQNQCCPCLSEEFTLVLKNLSFTDAARYRCELDQGAQQLEFQLEVLGMWLLMRRRCFPVCALMFCRRPLVCLFVYVTAEPIVMAPLLARYLTTQMHPRHAPFRLLFHCCCVSGGIQSLSKSAGNCTRIINSKRKVAFAF